MRNNKLHILVVDDDDRIRILLKEYLNENDYIVSTAKNSEEAKKKLDYLKFDIIILDVMMPGQKNKVHVAIATWEWGSYFDPKLKLNGIKLNISSWRRPAPNTIPWDTKAAGLYMICTLSKHEAEADGYTDSLMLDHEGNVAEATGANVFFKNKKGELHTPIPDSFLDGITRREVIKIAKSKGIKVIERKIKPEEMSEFIGCFLTGTAAEITPVSQISNYNFKVCDVISDLNDAYQNLVRKDTAA